MSPSEASVSQLTGHGGGKGHFPIVARIARRFRQFCDASGAHTLNEQAVKLCKASAISSSAGTLLIDKSRFSFISSPPSSPSPTGSCRFHITLTSSRIMTRLAAHTILPTFRLILGLRLPPCGTVDMHCGAQICVEPQTVKAPPFSCHRPGSVLATLQSPLQEAARSSTLEPRTSSNPELLLFLEMVIAASRSRATSASANSSIPW